MMVYVNSVHQEYRMLFEDDTTLKHLRERSPRMPEMSKEDLSQILAKKWEEFHRELSYL